MKLGNLEKDEKKLVNLKTQVLIKHQESQIKNKNSSKRGKRGKKNKNKPKPKKAPQIRNQKNFKNNFETLKNRIIPEITCNDCTHSQGEWCTLFKETIYEPELFAFACDSYMK